MSYDYNDFHKQSRDLENKIHDAIDNHDNPNARVLREEFRMLSEDFEQNKNPRSIENRINTIQQQLMQSQHSTHNFMSVDHSMNFHHQMQGMRMNIRKF